MTWTIQNLTAAAAILALAAGCAGKSLTASGPAVAAPDRQAAERQNAAQAAYRACLGAAVRYADDHAVSVERLALLIAPMCYPQFSWMEQTATVGMTRGAKRRFIQEGDQRQVDFATDAIVAERQSLALSAPR